MAGCNMFKENRQKEILDLIKTKKFVMIKDLMDMVSCSHATLQRDLNSLEELGEITRSYGGVSYIGSIDTSLISKDYLQYSKRKISHIEEKIAIGKAAQSLISDNDVIYLTHGTTTCQIAQRIDQDKNLTIITDGVDIIFSCERKPNLRVLSTGGLINYNSMQIEHSPYVNSDLKNIIINKLIMGIGGITETHGITFYDYASFSFLKDVIQEVDEIIVVADHTKFGKVALSKFMPIDRVSTIVTDGKIEKQYIEYLESKGIKCIIADD